MSQKTFMTTVRCSGIGRRTGLSTAMALMPGAPDSGIRFRRVDDAGGGVEVPADWRHVVEAAEGTVIAAGCGTRVASIERVMAALLAHRIDNAEIELDGPEVPDLDGGLGALLFLISCAGAVRLDAPRRQMMVSREVAVASGPASLAVSPAAEPAIAVDDDRPGPLDAQITRLGQARPDLVATVGDLYLAGAPICGLVSSRGRGHGLGWRLIEALFQAPDAWHWRDASPA